MQYLTLSRDRNAKSRPIRVVVADDQPIHRLGLKTLLAGEPRLRIVGEVTETAKILPEVERLWPDVLLTELALDGVSCLKAIGDVVGKHASASVFVLTARSDLSAIRDALKAGALGFGLKSADCAELLQGIRFVAAGQRFLSGGIDNAALDRYIAEVGDDTDTASNLTIREREVLRLVAQGLTSREIGRRLGIGKRTVESHSGKLLTKLRVRNKAQLVRTAIVNRIVD